MNRHRKKYTKQSNVILYVFFFTQRKLKFSIFPKICVINFDAKPLLHSVEIESLGGPSRQYQQGISSLNFTDSGSPSRNVSRFPAFHEILSVFLLFFLVSVD